MKIEYEIGDEVHINFLLTLGTIVRKDRWNLFLSIKGVEELQKFKKEDCRPSTETINKAKKS